MPAFQAGRRVQVPTLAYFLSKMFGNKENIMMQAFGIAVILIGWVFLYHGMIPIAIMIMSIGMWFPTDGFHNLTPRQGLALSALFILMLALGYTLGYSVGGRSTACCQSLNECQGQHHECQRLLDSALSTRDFLAELINSSLHTVTNSI
jgi:hypothetical protein